MAKSKYDWTLVVGIIVLFFLHLFIGHRMAPDSLTSGAILMVNILSFYVAYKLFYESSIGYFLSFVFSYLLLFVIFMKFLSNAEPLFLLAVMGLCGVARNFKLLSYFWALVISFTFCQPYAWETILILFFVLRLLFSIDKNLLSISTLVFFICGLALLFFVLFPILVLFFQEDPRNILNVLKEVAFKRAIIYTLITSSISVCILIVFGVPLAYVISRFEFFGKTFLLSLIDLPIIIPQSAAGIALLQVFSRKQYLGEVFYNFLGLQFDGTILGICLAQIFVAMPFIVKSSINAFSAVPYELEQNAFSLGAGPFSCFRRIALPLARKGIFVGVILSWARAAGEFGAVLFIAAYPVTAPIEVYNRFTSIGLNETTPFVSTILLFSLVMFFLLQYFSRRSS